MRSIWTLRGRFLLAVAGLVLVSAPIIGAQIVIAAHTRDQAAEIVSSIAGEGIARADNAIDRAIETLVGLSVLDVGSCTDEDIADMRRAVYGSYLIEEIAVLDAAGSVACNHFGDGSLITFAALSDPLASANEYVSLQLVELAGIGRTAIMVRRTFERPGGLAAIVSSDALTSNLVRRDLGRATTARLFLADGTPIRAPVTDPLQPPAAPAEIVEADGASERYPIRIHVAAPMAVFHERNADLLTYANIGGALASTLIFGLFLYVLRGPPADVADIREGIARKEFIPYYQPLIDIRTGRLKGCEVLVRRRRPEGTIVAPAAFINVAEISGLTEPMTVNLMRSARQDLEAAFGRRPQLSIAFNLAGSHFNSLRIVNAVNRIFRGSRIAMTQLVFEITERQPLADLQRARVIIRRLQALGARLALDDTGAGHAGLAHLQQLGVDIIKIDKLFIDTIKTPADSAPIVESMIRLGHDLGMEVVAEGVETIEQLDVLRRLGADSAQGFYFSPPLPADDFLELVEAIDPIHSNVAEPAGKPAAA